MIDKYMKEQKLDYNVVAMFNIKKAHSEITKDGLVSEDDSIRIISLIVSAVRSNDELLAKLRKVELAVRPPLAYYEERDEEMRHLGLIKNATTVIKDPKKRKTFIKKLIELKSRNGG